MLWGCTSTWWFIPLSKWVITPDISGLTPSNGIHRQQYDNMTIICSFEHVVFQCHAICEGNVVGKSTTGSSRIDGLRGESSGECDGVTKMGHIIGPTNILLEMWRKHIAKSSEST